MDLLTILLSLTGAMILRLVAGEVQDWLPVMSRRLIDRAVDRLPASERPRYREEWYAHLDEYPGKLGKMLHAGGCFLKAGRLVSELSRCRVGARSEGSPTTPAVHQAKVEGQLLLTTNYDQLLEQIFANEKASKIALNILYLHGHALDGKPRVADVRQALVELISELYANPADVLNDERKCDLLKMYIQNYARNRR
jgi:hypothetical protein